MMRLSMTHTLVAAQRSIIRFPLALFCAMVASYVSIVLIEHNNPSGTWEQILMASVLGIPFFLLLALALESTEIHVWPKRFIRMAGLLGPILYYLSLPADLPESHVIRFVILLVGFVLLVAIAPFWRMNPAQALWRFNILLLLRLFSSLLFTHVLYGGLSLALAALDNLLGVSLPSDIYLKLFVVLGFIFNTWYFLGGIPESPLALTGEIEFPHPLKVFAQYILSTLVMVYLAILWAYLAKVLLTGLWPSGWIGWLVSGVSVAGLLSVLLLSPLQGRGDNRWVGVYFRIFHILMLPSLAMLLLAVGKRINQYGLTELRYLLVILSCWVVIILILGIFSKRIKTRMIPLSLGLLALIISLGPWGAVSLSLTSQKNRLAEELTEAGLFAGGQLVPAQSEPTAINRMELSSSFRYLIDHYGLKELNPWLTPSMRSALDDGTSDENGSNRNSWAQAELIVKELGVLSLPPDLNQPVLKHTLIGDGCFNAIDVNGFEYALNLNLSNGGVAAFQWGEFHGELSLSDIGDTLFIRREEAILVEMPLAEILEGLFNAGDILDQQHVGDLQEMTFDYANENLRLKLIVHTIVFRDKIEIPQVQNLKGSLLLGDVGP